MRRFARVGFVVGVLAGAGAFGRRAEAAPPTVPVLLSPSDNMAAETTTPAFSWMPSTDPENEVIRYDFEVRDETDVLVGAGVGLPGTTASIAQELIHGATYRWRARATDASGAASALSPANTFVVTFGPVDCSGAECCAETNSCDGGCQASPGAGSGTLLGLGLGLSGLVGRRPARRRR